MNFQPWPPPALSPPSSALREVHSGQEHVRTWGSLQISNKDYSIALAGASHQHLSPFSALGCRNSIPGRSLWEAWGSLPRFRPHSQGAGSCVQPLLTTADKLRFVAIWSQQMHEFCIRRTFWGWNILRWWLQFTKMAVQWAAKRKIVAPREQQVKP